MKKMIISTFAFMLSASPLTACNDDKIDGDPARDWAGTTTAFVSADEQQFTTFYTRSAANAAEGKASGLSSRALSNGIQFVVKNLEAKPTDEPDPGE